LEGDINRGVAFYKKALYYNWHYADAMYNLGVAYGEMLKFDMVYLSIHIFKCASSSMIVNINIQHSCITKLIALLENCLYY